MQRTTLAAAGIATAVEALRLAYTGYFVPLHFTEPAFARYIIANDIDLDASPVWLQDGEPAAVGVAGLRDSRGWVGAFGVAPHFRGRGLAQAMFGELLRHIKRRRVTAIQLEVLDRNQRAIQIYERAGFKTVRRLHTFQGPPVRGDATAARSTDPVQALEWRDGVESAPCWQRERRSLQLRLAQLRAVQCGESFSVFRADGGTVSLLKQRIAGADADALLAALAGHSEDGTMTVVNEPEDSPLLPLLAARSWTAAQVQYEMRLTL